MWSPGTVIERDAFACESEPNGLLFTLATTFRSRSCAYISGFFSKATTQTTLQKRLLKMVFRKPKCELQHQAESFFAIIDESRKSLEFLKKRVDVLQNKGEILHSVDDDPRFNNETSIVSMMQRMIQSHNTSHQMSVCAYTFHCTANRHYDDDGLELIQCLVELTTEALLVRNHLTEQKTQSLAIRAVLSIFGSSSHFSIEEIRSLFSRDCVAVLCTFFKAPILAMLALDCINRVLGELDDVAGFFRPAICDALRKTWNSHTNKDVAARARTLLFDHQLLVTCGLCYRHVRTGSDKGMECAECKCFVCSDCDCGGYHLEGMELEWASSKKKPKRKRKRKSSKGSKPKCPLASPIKTDNERPESDNERCSKAKGAEDDVCDLDLVLYLEQTGSILAVDALMNILESKEEDRGEEDWQVIDSLRQATSAYRKVFVSCSN